LRRHERIIPTFYLRKKKDCGDTANLKELGKWRYVGKEHLEEGQQ
jgi:hypothetical protein